ncbi:hypothetical protein HPB52_014149 [Rhipicephalus sanguineus]|uniref:Uncharacterized protein n=1 Tax=Rhipicephalus sanguineus TaxID=34632 RepID=A0A9D4PCY6_RHISA|nr:hypothetical protein HPB52_014149 [Rhipicephalus sanguineus]
MRRQAAEATRKSVAVKGVKGPTHSILLIGAIADALATELARSIPQFDHEHLRVLDLTRLCLPCDVINSHVNSTTPSFLPLCPTFTFRECTDTN